MLPHMLKVIFDNWLLDICLAWKVFVNIPFHRGNYISSFTFQEFWMQAYGTEVNWMVTFFCPPWHTPDLHTKFLFKKKDLVGFWTWMEWDFGNLPMIEGSRTNSCTKTIYYYLNIHHWTKTQNAIHTWLP